MIELERGPTGAMASRWNDFWETLDRFFFKPTDARILALIRIATGLMIAYIHLVWLLGLESFFGTESLLDDQALAMLHRNAWKWSYLNGQEPLWFACLHEVIALGSGLAMALGCWTRWTTVIAWFLTLMTAHRLAPFLFGLDQIVLMLSMYLSISRCGDSWSLDQRFGLTQTFDKHWRNTLATRLIQLHLCVIYFFGGLGKARGWMWWDGTAMWYSAASYEYQSLDMTWIGRYPTLGSILTHATLFWEITYAGLVWPRLTRPWVLAIALLVHAGIAIFLGMITFGAMMIVANLAFLVPSQPGIKSAAIQEPCGTSN
jgi:hypothetical protein